MTDRQFKRVLVHSAVYPWLAMVLFTAIIGCLAGKLSKALDDFNRVYALSTQANGAYQAVTDLAAVHMTAFDKPIAQSVAEFDSRSRRTASAFAAATLAALAVRTDSGRTLAQVRDLNRLYVGWAARARADLSEPRTRYGRLASMESDRRLTSEVNNRYFRLNASLGAALAAGCRATAQYWAHVFAVTALFALALGGLLGWRALRQLFELRRNFAEVTGRLSASNVRLEAGLEAALRAQCEHQAWNEATSAVDPVTGLKNHAYYSDRLSEEFQRCLRYDKPLSVLLIEVDGFDTFTDRFGPEAGDELLESVGALLRSCRRGTDTIARFEGGTFAFLLPETDGLGAQRLADRICRIVAGRGAEGWSSTVSAGVASYSSGTSNEEMLVDEAMDALRAGKGVGSGQILRSGFGRELLASAA